MFTPSIRGDEAVVGASTHAVSQPLGQRVLIGLGPAAVCLKPHVSVADSLGGGCHHWIWVCVKGPRTKERIMSTVDKANNAAQRAKGKVKEAAGKATGNDRLANKGKTDQAKGNLKQAGEKVKDAFRG